MPPQIKKSRSLERDFHLYKQFSFKNNNNWHFSTTDSTKNNIKLAKS